MRVTVGSEACRLIPSELVAAGVQELVIRHAALLQLPEAAISEVLVVGEAELGPTIIRLQEEAGEPVGYTDVPAAKAAGKVILKCLSDGTVTNVIVLEGLIVETAILPFW